MRWLGMGLDGFLLRPMPPFIVLEPLRHKLFSNFACSVLLRRSIVPPIPRLTDSRVTTTHTRTIHIATWIIIQLIYLADDGLFRSFASQLNANFAFNNQLGALRRLDDDGTSVRLSRLIEHILDILFVVRRKYSWFESRFFGSRRRSGPDYVTERFLSNIHSVLVQICCLRTLVDGSTT